MKTINLRKAAISTIIAWTLGVAAFVASYFVPVMDDPDLQANWVLTIAVIPATILGAHLYYRNGYQTHGVLLGSTMFLVTIALDASITVPVFIIPNGGDHLSFFGDPGFWLIGLEYIAVVTGYWFIWNYQFKKISEEL